MTTAADVLLVGFARALREAGVPVTADRTRTYLRAVATVGMADARATYWAGRATLCASHDDLAAYDAVFDAWFRGGAHRPPQRRDLLAPAPRAALTDAGAPDGDGPQPDLVPALASGTEVLRRRDIAELSAEERARLHPLFAALRARVPQRTAPRRAPWHRGEVDAHRTLRRMLRHAGEPAPVAWRRPGRRPRRLVLLVDVSGSMAPYADALLRLAHRFVHAPAVHGRRPDVEVFTLGTRLTHVTRALRQRDPERALAAAGDAVPDWSGGTRLGETLQAFLDRWGRRGMARGAVVVVFSDGWERGGPDLLGQQMERLAAVAHRVVWANPHRGRAGYEAVQQGIVAALPHVDDFVAGHSVAAFAELVQVVADA